MVWVQESWGPEHPLIEPKLKGLFLKLDRVLSWARTI